MLDVISIDQPRGEAIATEDTPLDGRLRKSQWAMPEDYEDPFEEPTENGGQEL